MRTKIAVILLAAGLLAGIIPNQTSWVSAAELEEIEQKEETETGQTTWKETVSFNEINKAAESGKKETGKNGVYFKFFENEPESALIPGISSSVYFDYKNDTDTSYKIYVSSSNSNVVKVESRVKSAPANSEFSGYISFETVGPGVAEIIAKLGTETYRTKVYVAPRNTEIKSIKQTGYKSIVLTWKKAPGSRGYLIERAPAGEENYERVKIVEGGNKTSAVLQAEWEKQYSYRVIVFIKDGDRIIQGSPYAPSRIFATRRMGAEINSIQKYGRSSLLVKWKPMKGATGYKIYRSARENGAYKCISRISGGSKSSYKQEVDKGVTYYYKLITVYPEGESEISESVSQFIPKKGKVKTVEQNRISRNFDGTGQYSGNWAHSDQTYYYQAGGKVHVVCVQDDASLKIYTLDSNMRVKSTRTIKIGYDVWGGFYHGPDGNFYVAVGYHNYQEKHEKTVIKVIKYNSKWKKGKTAIIKGRASNVFRGIYEPFDAGNCRMDMQGTTLYLATSRKMFKGNDGLRHQSNISFKIDTKKMRVKQANDSYVSHSFNQFVKFKGGNLYVLDHGDAYPRALTLTMVNGYGTEESGKKTKTVFSFQGQTGDNYTGCTTGGMEIGKNSVLVCGTSVPHKYNVKGVSGYKNGLKKNVYLSLTNRRTGKTKVKWLTQYHAKNTSVIVGEVRMVKLSDTRFAVLYSTTKGNHTKMQYVVVSDTGKKVYSKTYPDISFSANSQPVLNKGQIVWIETVRRPDSSGTDTKMFCIPAIY